MKSERIKVTIVSAESNYRHPKVPQIDVFPGGEVQVKLGVPYRSTPSDSYEVFADLRSSDDVMSLMLVSSILRDKFPTAGRRTLVMPYIPYARQDRVCAEGDAFSLKVFAGMINSLGYDFVRVLDPHSDVAPALINNCQVTTAAKLIANFMELRRKFAQSDTVLISPDAGSNKKIAEVAKALDCYDFIRADKVRNCKNGEITGTKVYTENLNGFNCLIVDDICDGGRTFIELAKALKEKGAEKILLYVTHGIFSKGFEVFDNLIDEFYCANYLGNTESRPNNLFIHPGVSNV